MKRTRDREEGDGEEGEREAMARESSGVGPN